LAPKSDRRRRRGRRSGRRRGRTLQDAEEDTEGADEDKEEDQNERKPKASVTNILGLLSTATKTATDAEKVEDRPDDGRGPPARVVTVAHGDRDWIERAAAQAGNVMASRGSTPKTPAVAGLAASAASVRKSAGRGRGGAVGKAIDTPRTTVRQRLRVAGRGFGRSSLVTS